MTREAVRLAREQVEREETMDVMGESGGPRSAEIAEQVKIPLKLGTTSVPATWPERPVPEADRWLWAGRSLVLLALLGAVWTGDRSAVLGAGFVFVGLCTLR